MSPGEQDLNNRGFFSSSLFIKHKKLSKITLDSSFLELILCISSLFLWIGWDSFLFCMGAIAQHEHKTVKN